MQGTAGEVKMNSKGLLHMDETILADQERLTYISSVQTPSQGIPYNQHDLIRMQLQCYSNIAVIFNSTSKLVFRSKRNVIFCVYLKIFHHLFNISITAVSTCINMNSIQSLKHLNFCVMFTCIKFCMNRKIQDHLTLLIPATSDMLQKKKRKKKKKKDSKQNSLNEIKQKYL